MALLTVSQDFPKQITFESCSSISSNKLQLSNIPKNNNLYLINSNVNFTLNSNGSGVYNQKKPVTLIPEKKYPILTRNVLAVKENTNINKEIDIGFRSITSNSHFTQSYNNYYYHNNTINNSSSNTINNSKTQHYIDFFTNKGLNISNNGSTNQNITYSNASLSVDRTVSFSENTVVNQKNITNVTNITTINVTPVIIQSQSNASMSHQDKDKEVPL